MFSTLAVFSISWLPIVEAARVFVSRFSPADSVFTGTISWIQWTSFSLWRDLIEPFNPIGEGSWARAAHDLLFFGTKPAFKGWWIVFEEFWVKPFLCNLQKCIELLLGHIDLSLVHEDKHSHKVSILHSFCSAWPKSKLNTKLGLHTTHHKLLTTSR